MINFITYREPNENGELCFYILQKSFPHYVGKLVTSPREGGLVNTPIPGYNLWLTYAGCLHGNFFPGLSGAKMEVEQVFMAMAEFYYFNRIKTQPKRYSKFKINDAAITAR